MSFDDSKTDVRKLSVAPVDPPLPTRIGVARLTKLAFDGSDLHALWRELLEKLRATPTDAAMAMDMSIVAQLAGDADTGLNLQAAAMTEARLFRSDTAAGTPRLRLLALAGETDVGGNIPLEFLLKGSDVELLTLYVSPKELPLPLPPHDIAIAAIGYADSMVETIEMLEDRACAWPRPFLNEPGRIFELERDRFHALADGIEGIVIPKTVRVARATLEGLCDGTVAPGSLISRATFPIIVRPADSHAGHGLEKLEGAEDAHAYLVANPQGEFFISPFVDYSGADGLFRKYRVVFIDGRTYACHMAVASEWRVWYLNADMEASPEKRDEEARFMQNFDSEFGARHAPAFEELTARVGLDYFGIDCAETKDGRLLLFEGETAMIVHDMDPVSVYPYKLPQMKKLFAAFVAMLHRRAASSRAEAA